MGRFSLLKTSLYAMLCMIVVSTCRLHCMRYDGVAHACGAADKQNELCCVHRSLCGENPPGKQTAYKEKADSRETLPTFCAHRPISLETRRACPNKTLLWNAPKRSVKASLTTHTPLIKRGGAQKALKNMWFRTGHPLN